MDKKLNNEKAILTFLNDYARSKPENWPNCINQVIADRENGHFQLVRFGNLGLEYVHEVIFHFDLVDEKIVVLENRTDLDLAYELEHFGVDQNDVLFEDFYLESLAVAA